MSPQTRDNECWSHATYMTPDQWPATEIAAAVRAGRITCEAVARACIGHIREREPQVEAWQYVNEAAIIAQARALDAGGQRGPLMGVPIGVKDVIDTADMPTEYGSPIYRGHLPACDAACVALVRAAGAVIFGKTVSTEFATLHPGKTRNPYRPDHTPGGSSSGSAAAVASGMVPAAFGTQTSSSIVRPAAYCGVVGYKPSFNTINRAGLKPLAESLDTLGLMTRTVPDAALITVALTDAPSIVFDAVEQLRPRIGFCRTPYWDQADKAAQQFLASTASQLAHAGATVLDIDLPVGFGELAETQKTIFSYEAFRALSHERIHHPGQLSANLTLRLQLGSRIGHAQYACAQAQARRCRGQLDDVFKGCDVLLAPSATGEAPAGLASTGNPIFGVMWTLLHVPCVALPLGAGPTGLPVGAQVIGPRGGDRQTLLAAEWVSRAIAGNVQARSSP